LKILPSVAPPFGFAQDKSRRPVRQKLYLTLAFLLLFGALAPAATLTGTVSNGTTNKPAGGDEVVLLRLAQGMEEAGRTRTDGKGNFSFNLDNAQAPHLVRVIHQDVTYHRMAPPGTTSVEVKVYDVARKVEGVSVTADLMYIQAREGDLGISRIFSVNNTSQPPRTQMNDQNFEFYLPEGAQIEEATAQTAGGQAVNSAPVPQAEKNRYAFIFPLRPGETQFQVTFRMPYSGSLQIDPKPLYPLQHFLAVMPRSMQFTAAQKGIYQEKQPPNQPEAVAQLASNTRPGQKLAFEISGTGMLQQEGAGNDEASARDSRPGGGLGPPIDAPDPLEKYRVYILGGFGLVLTVGAIYIAKRPRGAVAGVAGDNLPGGDVARKTAPSASGRSVLLLEALKEELFQLEVEHKQGRISQQEYEKAKAALDQTLERAIKRQSAV
jgi:hypothetical protein